MAHLEVSAKTADKVSNAFISLAKKLIVKKDS
jgi:Ras-related protein Rab-1A